MLSVHQWVKLGPRASTTPLEGRTMSWVWYAGPKLPRPLVGEAAEATRSLRRIETLDHLSLISRNKNVSFLSEVTWKYIGYCWFTAS